MSGGGAKAAPSAAPDTTPGLPDATPGIPDAAPAKQPERPASQARTLAPDRLIALRHMGVKRIIAVGVLDLPAGGIALIDPGPQRQLHTVWDELEYEGLEMGDIRAILLTHIHLDHATATGSILRHAPDAVVHVHPAGAPHMIDPSRLLASAGRIYGDAMTRLWGEFLPVPEAAIRVVGDGDVIDVGGRAMEVAHVPGHAKHHVAYYEAATGTAWVGDVGGVRFGDGPALPVTPPPDIDVELWKSSMDRVMAWRPDRIVATHFGAYRDVGDHFAALAKELDAWAAWVRDSLTDESFGDDRERAGAFEEWVMARLAARVELDLGYGASYSVASGFADSWWGLARYWRKREVG